MLNSDMPAGVGAPPLDTQRTKVCRPCNLQHPSMDQPKTHVFYTHALDVNIIVLALKQWQLKPEQNEVVYMLSVRAFNQFTPFAHV